MTLTVSSGTRTFSDSHGQGNPPIQQAWSNLFYPALIAMGYSDAAITTLFDIDHQVGDVIAPEIDRAVIDPEMEYQTRNGLRVTDITVMPSSIGSHHTMYSVWGRVEGSPHSWTENGHYLSDDEESPLDLIPTGREAQ